MTLYEVESFLKKENSGRRRFLYEGIVDNVNYLHKRQKDAIENHGNYDISTLFTYIKLSGFKLYLNDVKVQSEVDLGNELRNKRKALGLSLVDLLIKGGITAKYVLKIEKGNHYWKKY